MYPAFNGWQKQEGRKPFLLHCRASAQWRIARTRPPIEAGGPERYWDNFQAKRWKNPETVELFELILDPILKMFERYLRDMFTY